MMAPDKAFILLRHYEERLRDEPNQHAVAYRSPTKPAALRTHTAPIPRPQRERTRAQAQAEV